MTKVMRQIRRKQEKIAKQNRFNLEALEQRLLLSADPITMNIAETLNNNTNAYEVSTTKASQTNNTTNIIDIAKFSFDDSAFRVDSGTILKGSGSANIDLINNNIVAPGYSPGVLSVDTYSQEATATLQIELGGLSAGTGDGYYDQINVSGNAKLDGTLDISLWNGFVPKVGDTFDIMTYSSYEGAFSDIKGLYGFNSDYYFEVVQTSTKIQLITREIISGDDFSFVSKDTAQNDTLGKLLNSDYLSANTPSSVTLSGILNLNNNLKLEGTVIYGIDNTSSILLSDNTTVSVNTTTIQASNLSAFFGVNEDFGISFNDADFSVVMFDAVSAMDTRSWVLASGSLGGGEFAGIDVLDIEAGSMSFLAQEALGINNTLIPDLSQSNIQVGNIVFNSDGKNGEQLYISATSLSISIANKVKLSGDLLFGANANTFYALSDNLDISMNAGAFGVAVSDAKFGLVSNSSGLAMSGSGAFDINGGDFANVSATLASFVYNDSDVAYEGLSVAIANKTYTLNNIPKSKNLMQIDVKELQTTIANMFTFSGDVAFASVDDTVSFVSNNASVALFAGDTQVGVKNANVGFAIDSSGKKILEANGGVYAKLNDDIKLKAQSSQIYYKQEGYVLNDTNKTLNIGTSSYTFADDLKSDEAMSEVRIKSASVELNSLFLAEGNFTFKQTTSTLKDSQNNDVVADIMTIGGSEISIFAGLYGGSIGSFGISLAGANFALAMVNEKNGQKRVWNTLKANANSVQSIRLGASISGEDVSIDVNTKASDETYIDYSKTSLDVYTSTDQKQTLSYDRGLSKVDILTGHVNVANFLKLDGSFSFSLGEMTTADVYMGDLNTLSDTIPGLSYVPYINEEVVQNISFDTFLLTGMNVSGFAGIGDTLGVDIKDVDFALAIMEYDVLEEPTIESDVIGGGEIEVDIVEFPLKFLSAKAKVGSAQLVGFGDMLDLKMEDVEINLNTSSIDGLDPTASAFLQMPHLGLKDSNISVSALDPLTNTTKTLALDYEEEIVEINIGYAEGTLANMLQVAGSLSFTKKGSEEVTMTDGTKQNVMSLALGGSDIYGFVGIGIGNYWTDTNNNGRIDDQDTHNDGIGLAIQDIDFGVVFMRSVDTLAPHLYTASKINLNTVALVGAGSVARMNAKDLEFDLNISTDTKLVDFAHSGKNGGVYEVTTGKVVDGVAQNILLDFDSLIIKVNGQATIEALGVLSLDGIFDFQITDDGLSVFVDAEAMIGTQSTISFSSHTTGMLVIAQGGIATRLQLEEAIDLGVVAKSDIKFDLILNTLGRDIIYDVPKVFNDVIPYDKFEIPKIPPQQLRDVGDYLYLEGSGNMELLSALQINGTFGILMADDKVQLSVGGLIDVGNIINEVGVAGTLGIGEGGMYGSLTVGTPDTVLINGGLFSVAGNFLLQINTTTKTQKVQALNLVNGKLDENNPFTTVDLEALYIHIAGETTIDVVGLELEGAIDMTISTLGLDAKLDVSMSLGAIGDVAIKGGASIGVEGKNADPYFAMSVAVDVDLSIAVIAIDAKGLLEINTGSISHLDIPEGRKFNLDIDGTMSILGFDGITLDGAIIVEDGFYELKIDKAELNFFNFVTFNMDGYIRSDGNYKLHGLVETNIDLAIMQLNAGMELTVANPINPLDPVFQFKVWGSVDITIDLGFFEISTTLAGIEGEAKVYAASASLNMAVTFMGMSFSSSLAWSWGAPPIISEQVGDTVYLNMGDRALEYRGDLYKKIIAENYNISQDKSGNILVSSLGQQNKYSGVKKIVARGGDGNDVIIVDPSVSSDVKLDFDGQEGDDLFFIGGGSATSVILGGDGDDTFNVGDVNYIHYYGNAGDDTFTNAGKSIDYIDMGEGKNTIVAGGGDDIIYARSNDLVYGGYGNDKIYIYSNGKIYGDDGDDTFYVNSLDTAFTTAVFGGDGYDRLELGTISSTSPLKFGENRFSYKDRVFTFDGALERVSLIDNALSTKLENVSTIDYYKWDNTGFSLKSAGDIDVSKVNINHKNSFVSLQSNTITGVLNTDVRDITIVTTNNITINEQDSLNVLKDGITNGGIYTSSGTINITLNAKDALLSLLSGIISTNTSGKAISIIADDIDFDSGRDMVIGSGTLAVVAKSLDQSYKLGTAGSTKYGSDYSKGVADGYMDFSAKDFDSLADNFASISIGHSASDVVMYIGDIEDKQLAEGRNYNAKLNNITTISAYSMVVAGDVQSSSTLTLNTSFLQILSTNLHDPMGASDSGIGAKNLSLNIDEQMILSGWLRAKDLLNVTISKTTGKNAIVSYGKEINSLTADKGSSLSVDNKDGKINISTKGSMYIASGFESFGDSSNITLTTQDGGITIAEGAVVASRTNYSQININSGSYVSLKSGGAITGGAKFVYDGATPIAVKSGESVNITIDAKSNLELAGSLTASGAIVLNGANSTIDGSEYFDNINGKTIASTKTNLDTILAGLQNGSISVELKKLFTDNKLTISDSAKVNFVSSYVPFATLTQTQKDTIAKSLGYNTVGSANSSFYYNESTNKLKTSLTIGNSVADSTGYTKYSGTVYYNATTNSLKTSFIEGVKADFNIDTIDWGNVTKPSRGTYFVMMTQAQKDVVLNATGYKYDANSKMYYNYNAQEDKKFVTTLTQGVVVDYSNSNIYWGNAGTPAKYASFDSLTQAQKDIVAKALGYEVYKDIYYNANAQETKRVVSGFGSADFALSEINFGGTPAPASGTTFESLTLAQQKVVVEKLGYEVYDGTLYYNQKENTLIKEFTLEQTDNINWEDQAPALDGVDFANMTKDQQKYVLSYLGYTVFTGKAYNIGTSYKATLVEGKDYKNENIEWSKLAIPTTQDFVLMSAEQKSLILSQIGYAQYNGVYYYNTNAETNKRLMQGFVNGADYSQSSITLNNDQKSNRFVVQDGSTQYIVYGNDENGDGKLESIDIQSPHTLLGQRGYGFMLTGTITSLQDNTNMKISSKDDVIVRGNINLFGTNSTLSVQSDTYTYWEGNATVSKGISLYGGVAQDGTILNSAQEQSLYIDDTSTLNTKANNTYINLSAGKNASIYGRVVAGGSIGASGVVFDGANSTVAISAGEQVYIDNAIASSKSITIKTTNITSAEDSGYGMVLSTKAGLNALESVNIDLIGSASIMGNIYAGAKVSMVNNVSQYEWSTNTSEVYIKSASQIYLGGMTKSSTGANVEVGGTILANNKIELVSGLSAVGYGILLPGAGSLITHSANGTIVLSAQHDALIYGKLIAGGEIVKSYDSKGMLLGSSTSTFVGNSSISISSEKQIILTQDLYAGKSITLQGGIASGDGEYGSYGVVVGGSVHLKTFMKSSTINIASKGDTILTAPAWNNEIVASGFSEYANGTISNDVTLNIELDLGTQKQTKQITLKANDTANNSGYADLVSDLQTAINSAFGFDSTNPNIKVRLLDGKIMLTSNYGFRLLSSGSTHTSTIGYTNLTTDIVSQRSYTIDASQSGSIVNIGNKSALNGAMYIAGNIRAYSAINLYSGTKGDGSQNFTLGATGVLETLSGSIVLNPGDYGTLTGTIIARGDNADITLNSKHTMDIKGSLIATRNITITAGTVAKDGETSITTYGTSKLQSLGSDGTISISGLNNVVINSTVGGTDNPNLKLISLSSTSGTMTIDKTSGRVETGASLVLNGKNIDIAGVIKSTKATALTTDYEVEIKTTGKVDIHGSLDIAGSFLVDTRGDINIYNTILKAKENQKITLKAGGDFSIGTKNPIEGVASANAVTISADKNLTLKSNKLLFVGSDAIIQTTKNNSTITIDADSMVVGGSIKALNSGSTIAIATQSYFAMGTKGLDEKFALIDMGGEITADNTVNIQAGANNDGLGMAVSDLSVIKSVNDDVLISSIGEAQLKGLVQALSTNGDITIQSSSLAYISNLIKATNNITITGGTHSSKYGVYIDKSATLTTTAENDHIAISAKDGIYISGIVGESAVLDNSIIASINDINIISSKGDISIDGVVDAINYIKLKANNINVLYPARLYVSATDSNIKLEATQQIFVDKNGLVSSDKLIHLYASVLKVSGIVETRNTNSTVYLSSKTSTQIKGEISSKDIILYSGILSTWNMNDIETSNVKVSQDALVLGNVSIIETASLEATNNISINAGGTIDLNASSTAGDAVSLVLPVITTKTKEIEVITGYVQVEAGTIQVPIISWESSTYTEQTGNASVIIGKKYLTMDISLEQTGYYNAKTNTYKEYFVEGVDYLNENIDWSNAGNDANPLRTATSVTGDYKSASYKTFTELNDAQKQAVLNTLGYKALYKFSYSNAKLNTTKDGITTQVSTTPTWSGNAQKVYQVNVAGWRDKYIQMPEGAQNDILKVVSQGEALYLANDTTKDGTNSTTWKSAGTSGYTFGEYVGTYKDSADVYYTQLTSALTSSGSGLDKTVDNDGSGATWSGVYDSGTGDRTYYITGISAKTIAYDPKWTWENTGTTWRGSVKMSSSFDDVLDNNTATYTLSNTINAGSRVVGYEVSEQTTKDNNVYVKVIDWQSEGDGMYAFATIYTSQESGQTNGFANDCLDGVKGIGSDLYAVSFYEHQDYTGKTTTYYRSSFDANGSLDIRPIFGENMASAIKVYGQHDISETFYNKEYSWVSDTSDIRDSRVKLSYQLTTQSQDIWGYTPIYETKTQKVEVVSLDTQTVWETQAQTSIQTQTYKERAEVVQDAKVSSGYSSKSLSAKNILINASKNINVGSWIEASENISITADGDIKVAGSVASGAQLEATSIIKANKTLTLVSDGDTILASSARLSAIDVSITSNANQSLAGKTEATNTLNSTAKGSLSINGELNAKTVSLTTNDKISGTVLASVIAQDTITLIATNDISLGDGYLNADDISISTTSGMVSHSGNIDAITLDISAKKGISATVAVDTIDLTNTLSGDISIISNKAININSAINNNANINITSFGTATLTSITTSGTKSNTNLNVKTYEGDIIVKDISLATLGDASFEAINDVVLTNAKIVSDELNITTKNGINITDNMTSINTLSATIKNSGNLSFVQSEAKKVTLKDIKVADGTINITNDEDITVQNVQIITNEDTSDITITSTKNITIGYLSAGKYAKDKATYDSYGVGSASITSMGDIVLSGTSISSLDTSDINIIADDITITAISGISATVAVNNLQNISTTSGNITLIDKNGYKEANKILKVGDISTTKTNKDTITLSSTDTIKINETSNIKADIIRLVSDNEDVIVLKPTDGTNLDYSYGIGLSAVHGTVSSYKFFDASGYLEYRAGEQFQFGYTNSQAYTQVTDIETKIVDFSQLLPTSLSADTIIVQTGTSYVLDTTSTLKAKDKLELISSNGKVIINGTISALATDSDGKIDTLILGAKESIVVSNNGMSIANYDINAGGDITIDYKAQNINITGNIASTSGDITLVATSNSINLTSANIITTKDVSLISKTSIIGDTNSTISADVLSATTEGNITLNTTVNTLNLSSTSSGNISIVEGDTIDIEYANTNDGNITIVSGDDMNAIYLTTQLDGGDIISLKSYGDMLKVGYIETSVLQNADKTTGTVILESAGNVQKYITSEFTPKVYSKNITVKGTTPTSGTNMVTFDTGLNGASVQKSATTIQAVNVANFVPQTPSYTLSKLPTGQESSNISMTVEEDLNINMDITGTKDIGFSVGGDFVATKQINVVGTVSISADNTTIDKQIIANSLSISSSAVNISTKVPTISLIDTSKTSGSVSLVQDGNLTINSIKLGSANTPDISIVSNGNITIDAITGTADQITIETTGDVIIKSIASATKLNIIAGGKVILGTSSTTINTNELDLSVNGDVVIYEKDNLILKNITQNNTDSTVEIYTGGEFVLEDDIVVSNAKDITIQAQSDITIKGGIEASGVSDISIKSVSGKLYFDNDDTKDIIAQNANLTLNVSGDIINTDNTNITIDVAKLTILSGSGSINITQQNDVILDITDTSGSTNIDVSGDIDISKISKSLGTISLSATETIKVSGKIHTTDGNIELSAQKDVILYSSVVANTTGDIIINTSKGNISNEINSASTTTSIDTNLAVFGTLKSANYSQISVDNAISTLKTSGIVLNADGGSVLLSAYGTIGTKETKESTIIVNGKAMSAISTNKNDVLVTALKDIQVANPEGANTASASITLQNLSGVQTITQAIDAKGGDVTIVAKDVNISSVIKSNGGKLVFAPTAEDATFVIGSTVATNSESLSLDQSELQNIQQVSNITFGKDGGSYTIEIGNVANTADVLFSAPITIINNGTDGHTVINSTVVSTSSYTGYGSGHTTLLSANQTYGADYYLSDSIQVDGARSITLTDGNITIDDTSTVNTAINGNSAVGDDTLSLITTGDITINASIGANPYDTSTSTTYTQKDLLEGLNIEATNVTFNDTVELGGDFIINASGVVVFEKDIIIDGDLIISGATQVVFKGKVTVTNGDITLSANEIDIQDTISGDGILTIKNSSNTLGIDIATSNNNSTRLDISASELGYIADGFSKIIFGNSDNSHTSSTSANNITTYSFEFDDKIELYANNITINGELTSTQDIVLDTISTIEINNTISTTSDIYMYSKSGDINQYDGTISAVDFDLKAVGGEITLNNIDIDTINISDTLGDINLTFADNVSILDLITAGNINITSTLDVSLDKNLTNTQGISFDVDGSFSMNSYTINAKNVTIKAQNDISINAITAQDKVILQTTSGAVVDIFAGNGANIESSYLDITSANGIDLHTSIDTIAISNTSQGSVSITDTDALSLDKINLVADTTALQVVAQSININDIVYTQSANITITADSYTQNSDISIDSGNLSMTIANDIIQNGDILVIGGNITLSSTSGKITMQDSATTSMTNTNGTISYQANSDITTGIITADGSLNITTTANITMQNSTNVTTMTLNGTNITQNANIISNGDMTITADSYTQNSDISSDNLSMTITNDIVQNANIVSNGDMTIISQNGKITMLDTISIQANDISYQANSDITTGIITADGSLNITTTANIIMQNNTNVATMTLNGTNITQSGNIISNGNITITADSYTQNNSTSITNGDMTINATNDILVNTIQTNQTISLSSTNGTITDILSGDNANLIAQTANLSAKSGINVHTTITTLNATITNSGDMILSESDDLILNNISLANGKIQMQVANNLTQTQNISQQDTVSIVAQSIDMGNTTLNTNNKNVILTITDTASLGTIDVSSADVSISATNISNSIDIVANNLTITATTATINTSVNNLYSTATLSLNETNGLNVINAVSNDNINITVQNGDLNIDYINAQDNISLSAINGSIVDISSSEDANIITNTAYLNANNSIGTKANDIDTTITTLNTTITNSGYIVIDESDDMILNDISIVDGGIDLHIAKSITQNKDITLNNVGNRVDIVAQNIDMGTTTLKTNNTDVVYNITNNTLLGTIDVGSANVNIYTTNVIDQNSSMINVIANSLNIKANTIGTKQDSIETSIDILNTTGTIYLNEYNNLNAITVISTNGDIELTVNQGNLNIEYINSNQIVTLVSTNGSIYDISTSETPNIIAHTTNLHAKDNVGSSKDGDIDLDVMVLNGTIETASSFVIEDIDSIKIGIIDAKEGEVTIIVSKEGDFTDANMDTKLNITANHLRLIGHGVTSQDSDYFNKAIEVKAKTISLGSYNVNGTNSFEITVEKQMLGKLVENQERWIQFHTIDVFVPMATDIKEYASDAKAVDSIKFIYTDYEILRYLMQKTYYFATKQSIVSTIDDTNSSLDMRLNTIKSNILSISDSLYNTFLSLGGGNILSNTQEEKEEETTSTIIDVDTSFAKVLVPDLASIPHFGTMTFENMITQVNNPNMQFEYWIENIAI